MKRSILIFCLVTFTVLAFGLEASAATARETVEEKVQRVVSTLGSPDFKQLAKEEQINQIRAIVNEVFDYRELSRRCLGRSWKKLNAAQQEEFISLFSELLEKTYADRLLAYTDEKIEFGKETELKKGRVEVESAIITKDGKQIPLNYRMVNKNGQWRVYDVVIEGISMVKNYRDQFRDILSKKTPEDLLQVLRDKVNK
jgi:phospholipid transport system substrate-binding protein